MSIVVVSGAIANKPFSGGEAWVRLNWVLGLQRLGYEVYFVEQIDSGSCLNEVGEVVEPALSANLSYFEAVTEEFGLSGRAALICTGHSTQSFGLDWDRLLGICESADLLVNLSGNLSVEPLTSRFRRKAYIDLDPGFTQLWHAVANNGARLAGHDFYFTVGENIATGTCRVPTGGLHWRSVRPPVVLDLWPAANGTVPERITTIATWRGPYGPVEYEGATLGSKVHEFRKILELPERASANFELALNIHPGDSDDLRSLRGHGWHVVDPLRVVPNPQNFRHYVRSSGAEFSVAQAVYVGTRVGWFSDRSAAYLASGKPVVIQDTGFSANYPTGEGLIPFGTLQEAVAGVNRVASEYEAQCEAARELAERYFDSAEVLGRLLTQAGVGG